ncbi:Helix-turn-helix [Chitinophaga sp. CF118]|uniref:helix-turn-helix domain-containing protein n=1 Tax=Chitinophaga sp. CF118 TaxID=1884367 RepID=UPI0008E2C1F5|nr:helix-turn-helix transcriptional regulator [Chitinophaga sp. CF118]SFD47088.1 Helix-turn-helix [Chitinophaga sp. CF118]
MKKIEDFGDSYKSDLINEMFAQITPEQQEETDYKMKMAAKIYAALQRKGWTQTQLAEGMNKQVSIISKWLSGTHNFTMDTLISIQHILDIQLLNVEETPVSPFKLTVSSKAIPISKNDLHQLAQQKSGMRMTSI